MQLSYLIFVGVAIIISSTMTALFRIVAPHTRWIQQPKSISIDTHIQPTPVGAGLAIYLAVVAVFCVAQWSLGAWTGLEQRIILAGGTLILIGLYDDRQEMSVPYKLLFQFLAAYILLAAPGLGSKPAIPQLFNLEILNLLIAIIWLVGMINAINFLDIMDGLAAGVALIAALGFFLVFMEQGGIFTILALALAGGALGFLFYNFEPASVFMGDTGSQFLGLILSTLVIMTVPANISLPAILTPLILVSIPLFEVTFTITIRTLTGKAPWKGSKDHYPLRLFKMGFSVKQIVLSTYLVGLLLILCAFWFNQATWFVQISIGSCLSLSMIGVSIWLSKVKVPASNKPTTANSSTPISVES